MPGFFFNIETVPKAIRQFQSTFLWKLLHLDSDVVFLFFQKTKQMTAHGRIGQTALSHVEEGSKIEVLSNQPSMVESSAKDLQFKTVTQILALLTAHGGIGQAAMPHVEEVFSLDLSRIKPVMVEMLV